MKNSSSPSRRMYESETDIRKQESIRGAIERWLCRSLLGPLLPTWRADYLATRHNHIGERVLTSFVKIKCRGHEKGRYPTLMISYGELSALHRFCDYFAFNDHHFAAVERVCHPRVLLVVSWNGSLHFTDASADKKNLWTMGHGGRYDRGDKWDLEKVYHIPIELFKPVPLKETKQ